MGIPISPIIRNQAVLWKQIEKPQAPSFASSFRFLEYVAFSGIAFA
jgi:hypothetical protein